MANHLSFREVQVIELIVEGMKSKEISEILFIEEKTVKYHLTNIYRKSNVKNRAEFISKFFKKELDPSLFPYRYLERYFKN